MTRPTHRSAHTHCARARTHIELLTALLATALLVPGCTDEEAGLTVPDRNVLIRGQVITEWGSGRDRDVGYLNVDLADETPFGDRYIEITLDTPGRFEFALDPGDYHLRLRLPSQEDLHIDSEGSLWASSKTFQVSAEKEEVDLRIRFGVVPIEHSFPANLGFWEVWLRQSQPTRDFLHWTRVFSRGSASVTDLRHVVPGHYSVSVETPVGERVTPSIHLEGTTVPGLDVYEFGTPMYSLEIPELTLVEVSIPSLTPELGIEWVRVRGHRGDDRFARTSTFDNSPYTLPVFSDAPFQIAIDPWNGPESFVGGFSIGEATTFVPVPGESLSVEYELGGIGIEGFYPLGADYQWRIFLENGTYFDNELSEASETTISLPPARYLVAFEQYGSREGRGFPFQWHDHAGSPERTTPVEVRPGEVTQLDWTVWEGATVSGTLSRELEDREFLYIIVKPNAVDGQEFIGPTHVDGTKFEFAELPQIEFALGTRRGNQWWYYPGTADKKRAETFRIVDRADIDNVDFELDP